VLGTGTDDVANNSVVEAWWIVKELPLLKRTWRDEMVDRT
jgi:hypothetical protein